MRRMDTVSSGCAPGDSMSVRTQMPIAVSVTRNLWRSEATAIPNRISAASARMQNSAIGPCVDMNDPRGAGKKNSATTLIRTMTAVSIFADRMSMEGPIGIGHRN